MHLPVSDGYLNTGMFLLWDLLGITGEITPSSLADKEDSNSLCCLPWEFSGLPTIVHSERHNLLFYFCTVWKPVFRPWALLQEVHSECLWGLRGQPEQRQLDVLQPALHNLQTCLSSHCKTPPACPKPLPWHQHPKRMQHRLFASVR